MWLSFSSVTLAFTPPPTIHLDLTSKKVATQRNQLEIQFSAWTESGGYEGVFMAHSEGAVFISTSSPPSFWFSSDPFSASVVLSFPSDGLYRVNGNLYDAPMLTGNVPEGLEADPLLATCPAACYFTSRSAHTFTRPLGAAGRLGYLWVRANPLA
jgi:hypothetical protein